MAPYPNILILLCGTLIIMWSDANCVLVHVSSSGNNALSLGGKQNSCIFPREIMTVIHVRMLFFHSFSLHARHRSPKITCYVIHCTELHQITFKFNISLTQWKYYPTAPSHACARTPTYPHAHHAHTHHTHTHHTHTHPTLLHRAPCLHTTPFSLARDVFQTRHVRSRRRGCTHPSHAPYPHNTRIRHTHHTHSHPSLAFNMFHTRENYKPFIPVYRMWSLGTWSTCGSEYASKWLPVHHSQSQPFLSEIQR